jgi:hypothetical protein
MKRTYLTPTAALIVLALLTVISIATRSLADSPPDPDCASFKFTIKLTAVNGKNNGIFHKLPKGGDITLSGELKDIGTDRGAQAKASRVIVSLYRKDSDIFSHVCSVGVDSPGTDGSFSKRCDKQLSGDYYIGAEKTVKKDGHHIQGAGTICVK